MSKPTRIDVRLDQKEFVASCPHVPGGCEARSPREHLAVNACVAKVREHNRANGDKPVPWIESPAPPTDAKDVHSRGLTGLWPKKIEAPKRTGDKPSAKTGDENDGN